MLLVLLFEKLGGVQLAIYASLWARLFPFDPGAWHEACSSLCLAHGDRRVLVGGDGAATKAPIGVTAGILLTKFHRWTKEM